MKYFLIVFIALFFIGCSQEDTNQTPPSSSYYLTYNDDSIEVTGQVTFDVGNIPNNHTVVLSNFRATLGDCSVDLSQESVDPSSIRFTSVGTKQTASVSVKLLSACTNQELVLSADYKDSSLLDGTLVTHSKEMTYRYTLEGVKSVEYSTSLRNPNIEMTTNSQSEDVSVLVFDDANKPLEDGTISIIYPDLQKDGVDIGSFSATTVAIQNGEAKFTYTTSADLQKLVDANITETEFKFYHNDNTDKVATLSVKFNPVTANNFTPVLRNPNIEMTTNSQSEDVSVLVFDDANKPLEDGTISIIYPDLQKDGVDIGSFSATTVAIQNGEAKFTYTTSADLQKLVDANITETEFKFYYNNNTDKVATLSVKFNPSVSNDYTLILKDSNITITKNKQTESIVVQVFDQLYRPVDEGKVNIIYPSMIKDGIDIGSFSEISVDVKSGAALFSYTAPNDLSSLDVNTTYFQFYYNDDYSNNVDLNIAFAPDENQTIIKGYQILFSPENDTYKMSLEETKSFSIVVADEDNNPIADADITDINVSLENRFIADLIDSSGNLKKSSDASKNNDTFTLQSKTISGLVPIHVEAQFKDANGEPKDLNSTFNIIVESGPPTAISISYAGTDQDKEHAKFIEHFAVSVTDKYFNPVNTNPQVSVGAIVGYAKKVDDNTPANTDNRIYEDNRSKLATLDGNILNLNQSYLEDNTTIDLRNDTLVTFGDGYSYPASGGWSIDYFDANDSDTRTSTITLSADQYDANKTDNLGFTIGHNYRQDACNFGDEWLGQAKLQNNAATIDESGSAIIDLSYDYYLVGKDIVVYINIIGKDNTLDKEIKLGEAKKHTLRGHGIELGEVTSFSRTNGEQNPYSFKVWITDTTLAYRNARFSFQDVQTDGECDTTIGPPEHKSYKASPSPIENCGDNNGQAYIRYTIKASAGIDSTCTLTVSKPIITNEF